ncbi:MAG: hypothetical protein WDZ69_01925 [Candidatus Pacearchaeota archaeon]
MNRIFMLRESYENKNSERMLGNFESKISLIEDSLLEGFPNKGFGIRRQYDKRNMKGYFIPEDEERDRIVFLRFYKGNFSGEVCFLSKGHNGLFEGEYSGKWGVLHNKIEFPSSYELFMREANIRRCISSTVGASEAKIERIYNGFI